MKTCQFCLENIEEHLDECPHCEMYLGASVTEKRKSPRFNVGFIVRYKDAKDPDAKWDISQGRDISAGGASFAISKKLSINTVLSTKVDPPIFGGRDTIEALTKVQYVKGEKMIYNAGVSFMDLKESTKKKIQDFLKSLSG
ncbi:MAG: PilZ domain-containing protein [Candidatus Omnitrophota bacterium]